LLVVRMLFEDRVVVFVSGSYYEYPDSLLLV